MNECYFGDCRDVLKQMIADGVKVNMCATSPPYWGLRDYGTATWEGGEGGCDHSQQRTIGSSTLRNDGREHIGTQPYEKTAATVVPYRDLCGKCGKGWVRVMEKIETGETHKVPDGWDTADGAHGTIHRNGRAKGEAGIPVFQSRSIGWEPSCAHNLAPVPGVVLDPFLGSGTVGRVAQSIGRNWLGIELNAMYDKFQNNRITQYGWAFP